MAHQNLKIKKKKEYNPFQTVTIKTAKVKEVKCFCKAVKPNPKDVFGMKKAEGLYYNINGHNVTPSYYGAERYSHEMVYYYEVGANDGSYRKCTSKEAAEKAFALLVAFEKRQTSIKEGAK